MGYVKVVKTSQYFSRFQVKYRRRRQGKTDYRARLRLVKQDKNKYNTHKYRLVVRFSNKDVTCQIVYSTIQGDVVVAAAYAHELPEYGLKVGLTNYSAAYCVGLLVARRVLAKFGLADTYKGCEEPDGEDYNVEAVDDGPRPFYCLLDTGLKRTSTGSKVFAALKGALDGGLDIPHNEKRFVGFADKKLDAETLQKYIYGGHVAEYQETMQEEEPEKYQSHFAKYVEEGVEPDDLEDLYKEVHSKIRANPTLKKKDRKNPGDGKRWKTPKSTYEVKKANLKAKLAAMADDE
uniref:Large ribosomal subunit protein uL18 C-terminal eukaryotes domain-containing protein n=1 Tax=Chlamydomonas leiostraca TaxID=1034604 RepID=A0A7S0S127_9CHLO|mmetsp:Transcript_3714/g.9270  ORF Transcript_3714/g.9270 Transcript_3714/m.9270 type:complete len:291 (+) Transcript_3714:62-934(+)|eukprot:CAMPEP_0202885814 /NCGR_PEP_ID=MMETSP1391-20130828/41848_1 /ASSEMBLY_ACC=CAM_ASM_000867 /TAXON_ID=1034604 /ORGANISM="Chlamydomonas leiostraca, Strain SAG 11-49" /LENGTH=290 /DNA_ID=CAMNT_0049569071 /DNA_START=44 /DNA_END=916 /DNA_ORIENTATION=+